MLFGQLNQDVYLDFFTISMVGLDGLSGLSSDVPQPQNH